MTNATHPFDALKGITVRPPNVFVRGEGSFLWDDNGRRYLDFIPDALRFMPALNARREEIALMIGCLDAILTRMGAARRVA